MPTPEQFLSKRQRYQPITFPPHCSEEEMARDWTLSDRDRAEVSKLSKKFSPVLLFDRIKGFMPEWH